MRVKDEYLSFRNSNGLRTDVFKDRVILQNFIRERLEDIWRERPSFANGGLLSNYMTRYAVGFAYYDCKPTAFCIQRCYGLPIAGLHDYFMLRLGVITSESFKTGDYRFIDVLKSKLKELNLKCVKIGHWGDATLEQVPHFVELAKEINNTTFWWYTRKKEVAVAANGYHLSNLKSYLSLDPSADYPAMADYPFGITYLFGDGIYHKAHDEILKDDRLIAVFPLKKGRSIEDPRQYGLSLHSQICKEKQIIAETGGKGHEVCLACSGRCNYSW